MRCRHREPSLERCHLIPTAVTCTSTVCQSRSTAPSCSSTLAWSSAMADATASLDSTAVVSDTSVCRVISLTSARQNWFYSRVADD